MFTPAVVSIVVRNTIFRKAPPSVVSGYGERSINLNKVVTTFEKHTLYGFSNYPCGVPVDVKNSEKINDIMNKSWIIQKGLRVTNACLVVNLVLHRGLKAIGVH
jgi:hypothetical protein